MGVAAVVDFCRGRQLLVHHLRTWICQNCSALAGNSLPLADDGRSRRLDHVNHGYAAHRHIGLALPPLAGLRTADVITADFAYIWLHGPGAKYQGRYGARDLQPWVERIMAWDRSLQVIHVYFDNDEAGYAPADAHCLLELLQERQQPVRRQAG
jgi:hypothetical protein